jgi:hypothetical protein
MIEGKINRQKGRGKCDEGRKNKMKIGGGRKVVMA